MEEAPKWEELNTDCLVNILARVGVESLLLDVPYVCKSWYKAVCIPQCWSVIDFTDRLLQYFGLQPFDQTAITNFMKYVVQRGNEFTTYVRLPYACKIEALIFLANECPNLKTLKLPRFIEDDIFIQFHSLISKWSRLESLSFTSVPNIKLIIEQISTHCRNFGTLEANDCRIGRKAASSFVTFLPNLKHLELCYSEIDKEDVLTILKGCNMLENFEAKHCVGFNCYDSDILEFASGKCSLELRVSYEDDPYYYEDYGVEEFTDEEGEEVLDYGYYEQGYYY